MPSPFPGVDPYLEHPDFWSELHNRLIVAIAIALAPSLRPKYHVAIDKRTYLGEADDSLLIGIPDVTVFTQQSASARSTQDRPLSIATLTDREPIKVAVPLIETVQESYLEIRETGKNYAVTVLEILSPKNKRSGAGREAYESKRSQVLASITNLVEIDLLRGGKPMQIVGNPPKTDYRILISRGDRRPISDLYAFNLPDTIPSFPLPLVRGDSEPIVDLQHLVNEVYEQAGFDTRIDYNQSCVPPLSEPDAAWANSLLQEKGFIAS
jgi:Protein of unknown function (DUF4058)